MSTDDMYNSSSRYLHEMYRIHFSVDKTLEIYRTDYLISSSIYEESYRIASSPFGDVTSNVLELSILNQYGMFNPKNEESPYFGYIKRGIKIEAFIRPNEAVEWDPLGVFYVADWNTSTSGSTAEITAYDKLYSILNAPVPAMPILKNIKFSDFMVKYFTLFDAAVNVDPSIDLVLPYGFTSGYTDNRVLLADLMIAAMADCFCNHQGNIIIRSKIAPRDIRAKFTDNDQIISAAIKQSVSTEYDSASVTSNVVQESVEQEVLSADNIALVTGLNNTEVIKFSKPGVVAVRSVRVESNILVKPLSFKATPDTIVCTLQSTADASVQLIVRGTVLETISSVLSTEGTSAAEIDSDFIQSIENANRILHYVDRYVNADIPSLDLIIRGNPKIEIGDRIHVKSSRYKLDYTGTVIKTKYAYAGGLSCEMTLAADMEV